MDDTKVDDMLIEMITPRIREIEERFSRGEELNPYRYRLLPISKKVVQQFSF